MKNQILLAIVGGALAVSAVPSFAQITPQSFNPDAAANATGNTANTISVSGNIPEFIQFTAVDNQLELGQIGGPTFVGNQPGTATTGKRFVSTSGQVDTGPTTTGPVTATANGGTDGTASVEFNANTFVRIAFNGSSVKNFGPDTASAVTTDDVILPTFFRVAVKGNVRFVDSATALSGDTTPGSATGYNPFPSNTPVNTGGYAAYSAPQAAPSAPTGSGVAQQSLTFAPGSYTGNNGGTAAEASGFKIMAEVERHGLNDYKGTYASTISLNYIKF